MTFDADRLPDIATDARRNGAWMRSRPTGLAPGDVLRWPGALPAFALTEVETSGSDRAQLTGIAAACSTIPHLPLGYGDEEIDDPEATGTDEDDAGSARLDVPDAADGILGAMHLVAGTTATTEQRRKWLEALEGTASDTPTLRAIASDINAPWWRWLPWTPGRWTPTAANAEEALWLAGTAVFTKAEGGKARNPKGQIDEIETKAHRIQPMAREIGRWADTTRALLRGEATIKTSRTDQPRVGLAIQLALLRPEPNRFRTWKTDLPGVETPVLASAAALCGLANGYSQLPTELRAEGRLEAVLAVRALRTAAPELRVIGWPSVDRATP